MMINLSTLESQFRYSFIFNILLSYTIYSKSQMSKTYKKRILAVVFVSLEAISIILDIFGRNNNLAFLLASFLLSAFGVVMTLCSYFVIEQGNGSRLTVVEIVFAFSQLILTYIDLVMNILHVKTYYNYKASVFPFAFAIIVLVFAFKSNEEEEALDLSDTDDPENRSPLRNIIEDQEPETTATQSNNGQLSIEQSMDDDGA
ncbi:hypothetical protein EZV62_018893 [Acer yangbiense]|uniref:Uncharacterized protein n=1 Tax=Acer yangbiense TaxID=1000413 RepID=A0A5C7H9P1_9ROSI|nr:hypothetical protein EZV62_018893 [Acer yangbiense]